MNPEGIITMILVLSVIWGGLAYFIYRAVKFESIKKKNGQE